MKLTVKLPTHSYDILIKKCALQGVGEWARSLWEPQKVAIITDDTVNELYGDAVWTALTEAGFDVHTFSVTPGEASKSFDNAIRAYDFLADHGFTRSDGIIALGGGVVGDLAGFVASTYTRGIHFLQIPTTLLAQVDSSVGGKTAVNTDKAKNLVGTFAQPDGVLIDPEVLTTLETRRVREGIAEIVKYAAIADHELWVLLDSFVDEWELIQDAEQVIYICCDIKRMVVEQDEFDNGARLMLNFGHTIGHALEASAGFGVVTHGEGVAIGMVQMNRVAEAKGLSPEGSTYALVNMLEKFGLPTTHAPWDENALFEALTHDKKARGDKIKTIVLDRIGNAGVNVISIDEMRDYLKKD